MKRKEDAILFIAAIFLPAALTQASVLDLFFSTCNTTTEYTCNDRTCIDKKEVCDGSLNCPDGSDESHAFCESFLCWGPKYFKCGDGTCVHANTSLCDGHLDCSDGSDELHCSEKTVGALITELFSHHCTNKEEFRCSDGDCITNAWVCDGHKDCSNDETDGCNSKKSCDDGEFMCKKPKFCVPSSSRCDGTVDCPDGTDEIDCEKKLHPIDLSNCTMTNGKFACKNHLQCISSSHVCDGKMDCHDKSDEDEFCLVAKTNKCTNCTHRCIATPEGGLCLCDVGFLLTEHNACVDENECERYGICDQKCVNTPGSYHCACDPNYVLQVDGRSCFIREGEGQLIYSVKDTIKGLTLKTRIQHTYFDNVPYGVGISAVGSDLYWTNIRNGSQAIVKAKEFKDQEAIITNGLGFPEDVVVDWITRNIYFSDYKYKRIVACTNDGSACVVLHRNTIDKPRSLALIPERGLLFWTDWGRAPHIGRSGMDGSNPINFVADDVRWPNGIAIDVPNERLYWVDAKLEKVETIKLDQTDRRVILSDSIHHPFSLAVFENKLYWSDLRDKEIHSCDKFTGKERQSITREFYESVHGIHIQHPLLEQTKIENPCSRQPCSDLCLLAPASKELSFTCACPINKILTKGSTKCIENEQYPVVVAAEKNKIHIIEHKSIGHSAVKSHQLPEEFNIKAMAYNHRQGILMLADLPTRSVYAWSLHSETVLPLITHGLGPIRSMEYDEFGHNLYFCDEDSLTVEAVSLSTKARTVILSGAYPEFPISLTLAPEHGFMFVVYVRVAEKVHIDRISMDGNEASRRHIVDVNERGSGVIIHFSRELEKLFWVDTETGIIESVDVNGNKRMQLFSNEFSYSLTSTGSLLFWTNSKSPILNTFDFIVDEYSKTLKLDRTEGSRKEFIVTAVGRANISSTCLENNGGCSHLCLASQVKDLKKVCACPSGFSISVDDHTCVTAKACQSEEFQCFTGECLPLSAVCDNKKDCIHGEDEDMMQCNGPKCPAEQFLCFDQSRCVDRKAKCDGKFDCDDKSDELCDVNCTRSQFACDSGECIDLHFRCDRKVDCKGAHDEMHCTSTSCATDEFRCLSGQCIPKEWECDTESDCADGSDEWNSCEHNECSPEHEFKCTNQRCINMALTCNGFNDCGDDSDETHCFTAEHHHNVHKLCSSSEFFCTSNDRHCIPISARCNGTRECVRGEDEEHCSETNPCVPEKEFFCLRDNMCIPTEWVCDGHDDCGDGADETKNACFTKPVKGLPCPGFKCNNSECIALSVVCDSIPHCSDKSDEGGQCHVTCKEFGCSHTCFRTPQGPICRCKSGYELSSDNKTCVDVNECEMNICAEHCENTMGGFSCACHSPEHRLRADRVSCKALGQPAVYVVSSKNTLFMTSSNIKHTSEIHLGRHLFDEILGMDVDVVHNYVYVLLENNIIERVSVSSGEKKQLIAPRVTSFTVDWVTEAVFTIHDHKIINVTSFNLVDGTKNNRNVNLYHAQEYRHISSLSVDPVAGYLFWFETDPELYGMIRRADCTGANVITILPLVMYPVRQLVVDSFNGHLYWFSPEHSGIQRMNYDGSGNKTVLHVEDELVTFAYFENKIYSISPNLITVRKCKIYGLPPKKCEMIRVNMHKILHLSILQPNRQRTGPNTCDQSMSSEYGLCLMSSDGPRCVCPDGKIRDESTDCSVDGSFSSLSLNDRTFGKYFSYFVVLCLIGGLAWIMYSHFRQRKGAILHRLHFRNPVYDIPRKSKAREALINAEEHSYDTPICEVPRPIVFNNNETCAPGKKTYVPTIEVTNHCESKPDFCATSKESFLVDTM